MSEKVHSEKNPKNYIHFDRYAGGRFLMAIAENQNLDSGETLILLIIGNSLDFYDFEHSKRYISQPRIKKLSKLSISKIRTSIRSLEEKGYLITEERYAPNGARESNYYSLSSLIFDEIEELWMAKKGVKEGTPPACGTGTPPVRGTGTPRYVAPPKIPKIKLPKEENNTKVLFSGGDETPPQKKAKSKKDNPKERSRAKFRTIYKTQRGGRKGFFQIVSNDTLDTVFERLYGLYSENDFNALYAHYEHHLMLGVADWDPNRPAQDLELLMMKREASEPQPDTRAGYIPPELRAEVDQDIH